MKKLFSRKKADKNKGSSTELKLLSFSKASLLLVASVTALTGGVYAISQSFAASTGIIHIFATSTVNGTTVGGVSWNLYAGHLCGGRNVDAGYDSAVTNDANGFVSYYSCDSSWGNYSIQSATKPGWHAVGNVGNCSAFTGSWVFRYPDGTLGNAQVVPPAGHTNTYYICMAPDLPAPTIIGADKTDKTLTLKWNPVGGAEGYLFTRTGWTANGSTSLNSYTFTGLSCNTTYALSVNAYAYGYAFPVATQSFTTSACPSSGSGGTSGGAAAAPAAPVSPPKTTVGTTSKVVTRPRTSAPAASSSGSADTQPPSTPGNLSATSQGGSVNLSWDASTDNAGVTAYTVERSTDGQIWTSLNDNTTGTNYSDSTVAFNTKYQYRVSSKDAAGNASDYAQTEITTSGFEANAFADKDSTITSEDKSVSVKIPAGALPVDASCKVSTFSDEVKGLSKKYSVLGGPYSFECKDKDGTTIDKFNKPIEFTVTTPSSKSTPQLYAQNGDQWENSKLKYDGKVKGFSFTTDQPKNFAVVSKSGGTNMFLLVFGVIIVLLAIVGIILWLLRRRRMMQEQQMGYPLDYFDQNPGGGPPNYPNANG